jgi:hypothetical protein
LAAFDWYWLLKQFTAFLPPDFPAFLVSAANSAACFFRCYWLLKQSAAAEVAETAESC